MKKTLTLLTSAIFMLVTFVACNNNDEYTAETPGTPDVPLTNVTLNQATATLSIGGTVQLTATISPENATNRNVTWLSSNTSVATVNNSGVVTAVSAGTAIITVTTQDGNHIARCTITVSPANVPVTSITLPATSSVNIGGTITLTATVLPANASNQNVTWSSNSTSVATVNNSGVVTGVSEGTAAITATTQDGGFTATSTVTVSSPLPMTGCNQNPPGWGESLGTVRFYTSQEWTITNGTITQIWSDAVTATNCQKTTFAGGATDNFNADCRSNPNFPGDLFSWCAVMRFADILCPPDQGWRVPSTQDFRNLDIAMGGTGNVRWGAQFVQFVQNNYITRWGGAFGGFCDSGGSLTVQNTWGNYWSLSDLNVTQADRLTFSSGGEIHPQGSGGNKANGFALRCVR